MPIGNEPGLVASVMLDIKDKMDSDLLVAIRWFPFRPIVSECIVLVEPTVLPYHVRDHYFTLYGSSTLWYTLDNITAKPATCNHDKM